MPKQTTVTITATAYNKDAATAGQPADPIRVDITLRPEADSRGEAIAKASEVARVRLGITAEPAEPVFRTFRSAREA